MYYCFITSTNNIASEMNTVAERNTLKIRIFELWFFNILLKSGRLIPSIGDMHESTLMLVKHSLDNKWSTVYVSGQKFWSQQLSRVHRTLLVVCKVTETASGSTGNLRIWCSDVFFSKVKEDVMIKYGCISCNTGICRTSYFRYNLRSVRYRYFFF